MPRESATLYRSARRSLKPSVRSPKTGPRKDIQGLRAIAVLAVITNHLFGYPSGGFAGVDVFFVISGFLITAQLIREFNRTGRISFADFYRRRIRRIMPASVLALAVTTICAYYLYAFGRFQDILVDGIWALAFTANWRFALSGADYMNADGPESPVQHFWSLAVEEQFYLVWPVLIVIGLSLAARFGLKSKGANTVLIVVVSVLVLVSFCFGVWESQNNASVAYFSTLSRAWELGIGALLAILAGRFSAIPNWARPVLGYIGFFGIIASIFIIDSETLFPGPGAAWPVLSSALVIVAGTGGQQRYLYPLTNPVMGYIGNISYSLYLWHFPTLILLEAFFPVVGASYYLYSLAVMTLLSALTYHWIEQPVLRSKWLNRGAHGIPHTRPTMIWGTGYKEFVACVTALGIGVTLTLGAAIYSQSRPVYADAGIVAPSFEAQDAAGEVPLEEVSKRQQSILEALSSTAFPKLTPSLDALEADQVPQWTENGCLDVTPQNEDQCVYGALDGELTAVLLGDSKGTSYLPGIIGALEPEGYAVRSFTMNQCPAADVRVHRGGQVSDYIECTEHRNWALDRISEINPDLVIFSNTSSPDRLMSGAVGQIAGGEILEGMRGTIERLPAASRLVILGPPPNSGNLQECATSVSSPNDCVKDVSADWMILKQAESLAAEQSGAKYVDPRPWFCSSTNRCPAFVDSTPVHIDGGHMTNTYSESLIPELKTALIGQ